MKVETAVMVVMLVAMKLVMMGVMVVMMMVMMVVTVVVMEVHRPQACLGPRGGGGRMRAPQSTAPQSPQSTFATKSAPQGPKCCACHKACTSRFTSRSPADAIRSKSTSNDKIQMPKRSIRSKLPPIFENEPHVQQSKFTAP